MFLNHMGESVVGEKGIDPPSRAVVNALIRSGFAVLAYDKRGVGASGGDFDSATYRDFIDDAIAAVEYLADRPDVDGGTIGLYVVSESGWFAPEIALRSGRVDFVFNKVGSPLSVMDTVLWEARNDFLAAGIADSDVQALVDVTGRRWKYYLAAADNPPHIQLGWVDTCNRCHIPTTWKQATVQGG